MSNDSDPPVKKTGLPQSPSPKTNPSAAGSIKSSKKVVPWNAALGVFVACAVFVVAQFAAAFTLLGLSFVLPLEGKSFSAWFEDSLMAKTLFFSLTAFYVLAPLKWFASLYGTTFASIGLKKPKISHLGWALLAFPAYYLLLIVILIITKAFVPGLDLEQKQDIGFNETYQGLQLAAVFFALVIVPPITEEIVFRGFIYSSLKKAIPLIVAAIITSLLFGAGHLMQGTGSQPLYIAGIDTFVLSMILIWLREKTGSLWSSIFLHGLKNGTAFVTLFMLNAG